MTIMPGTLLQIIKNAEAHFFESAARAIEEVVVNGDLSDAARLIDAYIVQCEEDRKSKAPYEDIDKYLRFAYQRKIEVSRSLRKEEDAKAYEQKLAALSQQKMQECG